MRLLSLALGISLALVSSTAFAATKYKVHLVDANTAAVGDGTFLYNSDTKKLTGIVTHTIAKPSGGKLYYKDAKNTDKTIKSYTATTAKSEVDVDEKLTATEEAALLAKGVYFEVHDKTTTGSGQLVPDDGTVDAGADTDAGTDTDASTPDPGNDSDSGTTPDPGNDSDSGTNPDPGTGSDTGDGNGDDSSNSGNGSSNDDGAEEEETSGKKGGCSMLRQPTTDSFALGVAMAGVLGAAFVARRKRRG